MNMKTVTVVKNVRITGEVTLAMTVEVKTILILKSARNLQRIMEAYCYTECGLFVLL
jgi:hypothetical protein